MTPVATPPDLRALTTLRFLAAAWVVLYTAWAYLDFGFVPTAVTKGYLGVEVFFVLSGFILSHVYLEQAGSKRFSYGGFLWARIARVYPLHLVTLFAMVGLGVAATLAGVAVDASLTDWRALPAHLSMTHAWGLAPLAAFNHPSWSISAEWFAYLSFPAFALVAWRLRGRPWLAVGLAAALVAALYAVFPRLAGFPLTQATFAWGALRIVPCFAYGCAVHLLWRSNVVKDARIAKVGAALSLAAILGLASFGAPDAALTIAFGALILCLASLTSTGSRLLSGRVGVYLGEISYAVYMVCFPWELVATNVMQKLLGAGEVLPPTLWFVLFLGVIPVAALAHHLVERPARTAMRRLAERRNAVAATA